MEHANPHFLIRLPRHCVSPRQVARAGDIWRLCQEAAVRSSAKAGWSGARFVEEQVGFIVSRMTVVHDQELVYGPPIEATTWIRDWRRETLSRREVRLFSADTSIARATQQWVHVALREDGITPVRAAPDLLEAFPTQSVDDAVVQLPAVVQSLRAASYDFAFDVWHTWMDPFAHVNHPVYVDWADEAISRRLVEVGIDPQRVVPIAEQVRFKRGLVGGQSVTVKTEIQGLTDRGDVVLRHRIDTNDGQSAADVVTVRRMLDVQPDWVAVFS